MVNVASNHLFDPETFMRVLGPIGIELNWRLLDPCFSVYVWFKYDLNSSTMHLKFDLIDAQLQDFQVMIVFLCP